MSVSFHHTFVNLKSARRLVGVLRRRRESTRERVREKGETFLGERVFVRVFHNPQKGKEE